MAEQQEFVEEDLLPIAIEYCNSKAFTNSIENFQLTQAKRFSDTSDSKSNEGSEIPHEYHTLFVEYQDLVDGLFETLAQSRGFTTKALYRCFRDAVDGKFTALFEEHEHRWFVDRVLSWMDFEEFLSMMRRASSSTSTYSKK